MNTDNKAVGGRDKDYKEMLEQAIICPFCGKMFLLEAGISKYEASVKELLDCAKELVMVVDDKDYDIDSFTTQPMRNALKALQSQLEEA